MATHCEEGHEGQRTTQVGPIAELRAGLMETADPDVCGPRAPELVPSALVPKSDLNMRSLQGV